MYYLYQKERYHESILCSHFDMILKNLSKIYMALERKIADKNKSFFKLWFLLLKWEKSCSSISKIYGYTPPETDKFSQVYRALTSSDPQITAGKLPLFAFLYSYNHRIHNFWPAPGVNFD